MSVAVFQVGTPGYFTHIHITTPIVFALKNYYRQSFLEVPTDILNHLLLDPGGGFRSETAVT
jgi:hypothetical protein